MNSWGGFIAMGGYGLYVWGSVGMVVFCLIVEQIGLRVRFKSSMDKLTMESEVAPNAAPMTELKR